MEAVWLKIGGPESCVCDLYPYHQNKERMVTNFSQPTSLITWSDARAPTILEREHVSSPSQSVSSLVFLMGHEQVASSPQLALQCYSASQTVLVKHESHACCIPEHMYVMSGQFSVHLIENRIAP